MTVFQAACKQLGLGIPVPEYQFAPPRKWRFDWAFILAKVAVEIEGGVWLSSKGKKSRHFHGQGAINDMEKYNQAAVLGWRIIRVSPKQFESGEVLRLVELAIKGNVTYA